jgi:hypothetical protein
MKCRDLHLDACALQSFWDSVNYSCHDYEALLTNLD